jgi:hypothetical protein
MRSLIPYENLLSSISTGGGADGVSLHCLFPFRFGKRSSGPFPSSTISRDGREGSWPATFLFVGTLLSDHLMRLFFLSSFGM